MGLKSGSRDAGLDDEGETESDASATTTEEPSESDDEDSRSPRNQDRETTDSRSTEEQTETTSPGGDTAGSDRPSMESIPYKLRRDKVNEGRQQVPYFLRDDVIEKEDELQKALEAMLGEDVYKSDYREAAMVVAQRKPELVAEVLREWGYDLN